MKSLINYITLIVTLIFTFTIIANAQSKNSASIDIKVSLKSSYSVNSFSTVSEIAQPNKSRFENEYKNTQRDLLIRWEQPNGSTMKDLCAIFISEHNSNKNLQLFFETEYLIKRRKNEDINFYFPPNLTLKNLPKLTIIY